MTDIAKERALDALRSFGGDFSRWPEDRAAAGRRLLVGDLGFRAAYESERRLDRALAAARAEEAADPTIAAMAGRVRGRAMARARRGPAGRLRWERIAAAMLVAGMLGAAADFALLDRDAGTDLVMLDPLAEGADLQ